MARLRRQGIYGENLPTKKSKNIEPADFLIGGIVAQFERKYESSFRVRNMEEFRRIFGEHVIPTYYGWDAVQGFFDNAVGVDAKLYVKSYVGNVAGVTDAVTATADAVDGAAAPVLQIDAAYEEELEFGVSGNRTGYTIEKGASFTTAVKTANLAADVFVILDSVAGIKVGDIMKVMATGGGVNTVYKKIVTVDEGTGTVTFTGAFHGVSNAAADDVVTIEAFRIHTWRKSLSGMVTEVDLDLGKTWCGLEAEVVDTFVENVFAISQWIKVTDLAPATVVGATYGPAAVTTVTYLTTGADGTAPTVTAQWTPSLDALDEDPVRFICNPESTDIDIQKAIELYCKGRNDLPKVIYNIIEDQTKAQMIAYGNLLQRSDDVLGVLVGNWFEKEDPFATAINAPRRTIPSVGHTMGLWVRSIGTRGIHWIPAIAQMPYYGVTGVVGEQLLDDFDRTDACEAGVNVIQSVLGSGIILKSFYTPSTTKEFTFGNGILMREFIKISIIDSLEDTLNEPNNFERIKASRSAIVRFFFSLWRSGNTGNSPEGETFGQTIDPVTQQGTDISNHYQVQADLVNNPQASIEAGNRNLDSWFTYPAPAASIKIGVGLMLLG